MRPYLVPLLLLGLLGAESVSAKPKDQPLTAQFYRKNCMLCHKTAIPEGIDPSILVGVQPAHPTRPRDAMPNVLCWRRCEKCWIKPGKASR